MPIELPPPTTSMLIEMFFVHYSMTIMFVIVLYLSGFALYRMMSGLRMLPFTGWGKGLWFTLAGAAVCLVFWKAVFVRCGTQGC